MSKTWVALPVVSMTLAACVTINIYFPAAAAEKAADKIIEEVWQTKKSGQPEAAQEKPNKTDTVKEPK